MTNNYRPWYRAAYSWLIGILALAVLLQISACTSSKKSAKQPKPVKGRVTTADKRDITPQKLHIDPFANADTIKKMQVLLYLSGYEPGKIDGLLKEQTIKAIEDFQRLKNIHLGDRSDTTLHAIGVTEMNFTVRDLQETLSKKGYDAGPIDDIIGPMTRGAYIEFLQNNELSSMGLSEEVRNALFSDDAKYQKPLNTDPLFRQGNTFIPSYSSSVPLRQATIPDIQQALRAKGYDPGPNADMMTPIIADALYLFQCDKKLPIGGINYDTLRALGFKE